jgi:hypothetical protein
MRDLDEIRESVTMSESELQEYHELLNQLLIRQFFSIFTSIIVGLFFLSMSNEFRQLVMYALCGILAASNYYCMSVFTRECISKKLMGKSFPTEIFGAMIITSLLIFVSIHLLISGIFVGNIAIAAELFNSAILLFLVFHWPARASKIAKRLSARLSTSSS